MASLSGFCAALALAAAAFCFAEGTAHANASPLLLLAALALGGAAGYAWRRKPLPSSRTAAKDLPNQGCVTRSSA